MGIRFGGRFEHFAAQLLTKLGNPYPRRADGDHSPIRACLCRGPSRFIWLGQLWRRFRRHARVPRCPGTQ
eukprot:2410857-Pyramimonas_sp.AAC.1